jgi:hypothetical protein
MDLAEKHDIGPDTPVQQFLIPDGPAFPVIERVRRSVS